MRHVVIAFVRAYQMFLGPLLPVVCRFYPSCSQYAIESLRRYGTWRGLILATRRIVRCHPLHPGGYDPVP